MYDKLAFAVLTPQQSQIDKRFAAILGIKEAKQLLDKQLGLAEEPIRTSSCERCAEV